MKQIVLSCAIVMALVLAAPPGWAADCYADYKAKQDQPLRLHYGVMALQGSCDAASAKQEVAARLRQQGWTLLRVRGVFGPEGLQQRKADAGKFFLRF